MEETIQRLLHKKIKGLLSILDVLLEQNEGIKKNLYHCEQSCDVTKNAQILTRWQTDETNEAL